MLVCVCVCVCGVLPFVVQSNIDSPNDQDPGYNAAMSCMEKAMCWQIATRLGEKIVGDPDVLGESHRRSLPQDARIPVSE